ncbi:hypothetical protein V8F20_010931 [Naviculisporaceae sp. PSN 640]
MATWRPKLHWHLHKEGKQSIREQYAFNHLRHEMYKIVSKDESLQKQLPIGPDFSLPEPPAAKPSPHRPDGRKYKVAIVGAGVTGLFLGMMFDYFKTKVPHFDIEYDIIEAGPEDRVGGRLFTYNFPPKPGAPSGPHDYYDVGGMRFPENPVMTRVFELFRLLDMHKQELKPDTPNGALIPYSMTNTVPGVDGPVQNEPFCYNGITKWGSYTDIAAEAGEGGDAFGFNQDPYAPAIPTVILKSKPGDVVDEALKELRDAIKDDEKKGWDLLMKYDKHTTRDWMGSYWDDDCYRNPMLPPFNATTINFLETMNGGTDWYDQALSETVLESLDFDYADPGKSDPYSWWCVMGGAQQLPIRMEKTLARKPIYNTTVKAISAIPLLGSEWQMEVTTAPTDKESGTTTSKQQYNGVFNTTTLGCLRRIDTSACTIPNSAKMAHRALAYGQSCKVGIKFKHAWWIHSLPENHRITSGGLGHSDLHIRTVVYPSYNIVDPEDKPAVLLVSYTWQQDAERVGALISRKSPADEDELKTLLLHELAKLHTTTPEEEKDLFEKLAGKEDVPGSGLYMDHYAHDWSRDKLTAGAFAFFRAQQFSTLWPKIVVPSGNLVIAGEAASPHHAWVVGALESAVVGLYSWLYSRQDIPGAAEVMRLIDHPDNEEEEGGGDTKKEKEHLPFVGLPKYMPKAQARTMGIIAAHRLEEADGVA